MNVTSTIYTLYFECIPNFAGSGVVKCFLHADLFVMLFKLFSYIVYLYKLVK